MSSVAFVIPKIVDNLDGWGPSTIPEQFKELPYKPFNKGDKISKAADWTQTTNTGKKIILFFFMLIQFHIIDAVKKVNNTKRMKMISS